MKIGVVGMGSIGRQHVRQLNKLGGVVVHALRTRRGVPQVLGNEFSQVVEHESEEVFFASGLAGVIISNPTHLHVEYALKSVRHGIPVLIEKPVEHTQAGLELLKPFAEKIRIAYCLRFHPIIREVKNKLLAKIGRLFKITFTRGFHLPFWHPYADYRVEYAAQKAMGGGASRTLSHEIDLINFYKIGPVVDVSGCIDKISNLEIDTDDFAFFSCLLKSGARANYEIDFLNYNNTNRCTIVGSNGQIDIDLEEGKVDWTDRSSRKKQVFTHAPDEAFDTAYFEQMRDFVIFLREGRSENCTVAEAYSVIDIIEKVEMNPKFTQ
ncbi:MAG: Gfo/Idh/MocA family protein [Bacteroidota bacterium]